MPHYVLTCIDKPNGRELRDTAREAHLAYVRTPGSPLKFSGPFLDEEERMIGSLMIVDVPDRAAAEAFSAADPYVAAGVWASVDIRRFKVSNNQL